MKLTELLEVLKSPNTPYQANDWEIEDKRCISKSNNLWVEILPNGEIISSFDTPKEDIITVQETMKILSTLSQENLKKEEGKIIVCKNHYSIFEDGERIEKIEYPNFMVTLKTNFVCSFEDSNKKIELDYLPGKGDKVTTEGIDYLGKKFEYKMVFDGGYKERYIPTLEYVK